MRFSKIAITKKGVELVHRTADDHGSEETTTQRQEAPLSTFSDSMQAFTSYVNDLLEIPETWRAGLTVTTLNLSIDKDGNRGLIVTATRPVAKAYNRPLVLNTPLVREGSENASADAFVLSDLVLDLIEAVEEEATRYYQGERVQTEMFTKPELSENVKAADDRMASAAVQSTRRPKQKRALVAQTETGVPVVNPSPGVPLTDENLRQLLLSVDRDVPVDAIKKWTSGERDSAQRWSEARQKEMTGQLDSAKIGVEPKCVIAAATPPLADSWTTKPPPRAKDVHPVVGHVQ